MIERVDEFVVEIKTRKKEEKKEKEKEEEEEEKEKEKTIIRHNWETRLQIESCEGDRIHSSATLNSMFSNTKSANK